MIYHLLAGFTCKMNPSLHRRDTTKEILTLTSLTKTSPTWKSCTEKTPPAPTTTQVSEFQTDRKKSLSKANETREALVKAFQMATDDLPKYIFLVPTSSTNGALTKNDMNYKCLDATHHEYTANIYLQLCSYQRRGSLDCCDYYHQGPKWKHHQCPLRKNHLEHPHLSNFRFDSLFQFEKIKDSLSQSQGKYLLHFEKQKTLQKKSFYDLILHSISKPTRRNMSKLSIGNTAVLCRVNRG
jgi:hypothetical protein